jgi:hypothetical protein
MLRKGRVPCESEREEKRRKKYRSNCSMPRQGRGVQGHVARCNSTPTATTMTRVGGRRAATTAAAGGRGRRRRGRRRRSGAGRRGRAAARSPRHGGGGAQPPPLSATHTILFIIIVLFFIFVFFLVFFLVFFRRLLWFFLVIHFEILVDVGFFLLLLIGHLCIVPARLATRRDARIWRRRQRRAPRRGGQGDSPEISRGRRRVGGRENWRRAAPCRCVCRQVLVGAGGGHHHGGGGEVFRGQARNDNRERNLAWGSARRSVRAVDGILRRGDGPLGGGIVMIHIVRVNGREECGLSSPSKGVRTDARGAPQGGNQATRRQRGQNGQLRGSGEKWG